MFTQNQLCSYNLPLFDDDKTMYFNEPILHKYLTDKSINISKVISEFKKKEDTCPFCTLLPLNQRLGLDSEQVPNEISCMDSLRSSEIIKLRAVLCDVLECKQCSRNDFSEFVNLSEVAPYILKKYTT